LRLVPASDTPIVRARINTGDNDQLHTGQETRIRFSTFNQRATPVIMA